MLLFGLVLTRFLYLMVPPLVTAPSNKKRAWSWPAYLEEERAVAAPVKLFKEVRRTAHTHPLPSSLTACQL